MAIIMRLAVCLAYLAIFIAVEAVGFFVAVGFCLAADDNDILPRGAAILVEGLVLGAYVVLLVVGIVILWLKLIQLFKPWPEKEMDTK